MFEREQYQIQIIKNMKSLFISPNYIQNERDRGDSMSMDHCFF